MKQGKLKKNFLGKKKMMITKEELAEWLHDQYEEIAKEKGWQTQEKSRVKFEDLPKENKETMLALSEKILTRFRLNMFSRFWKK